MGRKFLTPPNLWRYPNIATLHPPIFKFCSHPTPSPFFLPQSLYLHCLFFFFVVIWFLWLNGLLWNIWCVIWCNDIMVLHMSSLVTLIPEEPCCVFYTTRHQIYCGRTHTENFLLVLRFDITPTKKDTPI